MKSSPIFMKLQTGQNLIRLVDASFISFNQHFQPVVFRSVKNREYDWFYTKGGFTPTVRFAMHAIDRGDNNILKIFEFGKSLGKQLAYYKQVTGLSPSGMHAVDFLVEKKTDQKFPYYNVVPYGEPYKLNEEDIENYKNNCHDLHKMFAPMPNEKMDELWKVYNKTGAEGAKKLLDKWKNDGKKKFVANMKSMIDKKIDSQISALNEDAFNPFDDSDDKGEVMRIFG